MCWLIEIRSQKLLFRMDQAHLSSTINIKWKIKDGNVRFQMWNLQEPSKSLIKFLTFMCYPTVIQVNLSRQYSLNNSNNYIFHDCYSGLFLFSLFRWSNKISVWYRKGITITCFLHHFKYYHYCCTFWNWNVLLCVQILVDRENSSCWNC